MADILKKRPQAEKIIANAVMKHYSVVLDSLPERDSDEKPFVAPLCRDVVASIRPVDSSVPPPAEQDGEEDEEEEDQLMDEDEEGQVPEDGELQVSLPAAQTADNGLVCISKITCHMLKMSCSSSSFHLQGHIGQDTLSHMIRLDEMVIPRRRRYSFHYHNHNFYDYTSRLRYPAGMLVSHSSTESVVKTLYQITFRSGAGSVLILVLVILLLRYS